MPTAVEPVNDSLRTSGCDVSTPPIVAASPVTMFSTPGGNPARCASSASASAVNGVCEAGFATTVQPAVSAAPALRVSIAAGKFHGVINAATPTGCCSVSMRRSAHGDATTSP